LMFHKVVTSVASRLRGCGIFNNNTVPYCKFLGVCACERILNID